MLRLCRADYSFLRFNGLTLSADLLTSRQQRPRRLCQLLLVIAAREQMAI